LIYLDTSVLVALLTNESTAAAIRLWYGQTESGIFATSDWSLSEFASALSLKQRTGQLTAEQVVAVHQTFDVFSSGGVRFLEVSRQAFRKSATLIKTMPGLRAGDALHLAVALESGINEFATLDKLLAEKAAQVNLTLSRF
jgi:predicted nucleic acid-binding protein